MREPLPGWWLSLSDGAYNFHAGGACLTADRAWSPTDDAGWQWRVEVESETRDCKPTALEARIAAENAARAMVADMAKALGGIVTWGESEVSGGQA